MFGITVVTLIGIAIAWVLYKAGRAIVKELNKPPPYLENECPNKGKYPAWSMFSTGTYHARRRGTDNDMIIAGCDDCGYSPPTIIGGSALTDVIHGYPDLQHP